MLCADLLNIQWEDESGRSRETLANLEDISQSGACLQLDMPIPLETLVLLKHPKADLRGRVRYCLFRETGYFLGVQFESGTSWSRRRFRPRHLLDPRRLLGLLRRRPVGKADGPFRLQ